MNNKIYNIKFIHTLSKMRKYSLVLIYIKFSNSQIFDNCKKNNLQKIKSNIEFIVPNFFPMYEVISVWRMLQFFECFT